jgi:hypothetical protein
MRLLLCNLMLSAEQLGTMSNKIVLFTRWISIKIKNWLRLDFTHRLVCQPLLQGLKQCIANRQGQGQCQPSLVLSILLSNCLGLFGFFWWGGVEISYFLQALVPSGFKSHSFSNWIQASAAKAFPSPFTSHAGVQPQEKPRPCPRNKLPLQTGSNNPKQEAFSPAHC